MENETLTRLYMPRRGKRRRISSYDRTGANADWLHVPPRETLDFARFEGEGVVEHIWITMANYDRKEEFLLRKVVLRVYWDDEETPSVEAPMGDFFGMGHATSKNYVSAPLQMSPEDGKGFNSWWQMPFRKGFRFSVENDCDLPLQFYFYVDFEERKVEEDALYFHARWHRECPTRGVAEEEFAAHRDWCFGGENRDGTDNYVILEAEGKGHYCGANINIHNLNRSDMWDWPGEGDDMIFIDGDETPTLHGTGTEDYVNMAWCPQQEYAAPYHGLLLGGARNWKGKISYYRYHILDPIGFEKRIKVTIEHGHCNHRSDDWSSTAYWYQTEPHKPYEPIPCWQERMPVSVPALEWDDKIEKIK